MIICAGDGVDQRSGTDEKQARAARQVFSDGDAVIATTVILECEWVPRAGYGFAPKEIAQAFAP